MAWTTKVLKVLKTNEWKGKLKAKFEITQQENSEGKHFAAGLQKTGYYEKDGEVVRGYQQPFTTGDLTWLAENWSDVISAMNPGPKVEAKSKKETDNLAPSEAGDAQDGVPF